MIFQILIDVKIERSRHKITGRSSIISIKHYYYDSRILKGFQMNVYLTEVKIME